MPTELAPNQHELLDSGENTMLVFGTEATRFVTLDYPLVESGQERLSDIDRMREDGQTFGEDFTGGKSITYTIAALTDTAENPHEALEDALDEFDTMWKNPALRVRANRYAILRSQMVPGRTRRCYGRPRRCEPTADRLAHRGKADLLCDFTVMDGQWYDDGLRTAEATSTVTGFMQVSGTRSTWASVHITGPLTAGRVEIFDATGAGIVVALSGNVAAGETLTWDPRPWARTFLDHNQVTAAARLAAHSTPMRGAALPPGLYTVRVTGSGMTAATRARAEWRDAYGRW